MFSGAGYDDNLFSQCLRYSAGLEILSKKKWGPESMLAPTALQRYDTEENHPCKKMK